MPVDNDSSRLPLIKDALDYTHSGTLHAAILSLIVHVRTSTGRMY